jgi:lysozyme family protein
MWIRCDEAGQVVETTTIDPAGRYPSSVVWTEAPAALERWIEPGWSLGADGVIGPPTLDALKTEAKRRVADRRTYERNRGVVIAGQRWHSDKGSCDDVATAVTMAAQVEAGGGAFTTVWKTMDGFTTVTLPQLVTAGVTVGAHVQTCFARESAIAGLIDAATTVEAVIAACDQEINQGWPG